MEKVKFQDIPTEYIQANMEKVRAVVNKRFSRLDPTKREKLFEFIMQTYYHTDRLNNHREGL